MAKFRHLAFVCENPSQVAEFLNKAFDIEILYRTAHGVVVMSDGVVNLTLLTPTFSEHDPALWHFGLEMTQDELEARRPIFEELGAELQDGLHDGRPVEAFLRTPEGQRVDVAPFWPTQKGQSRRQQDYRSWTNETSSAPAST